MYIGMDHLPVSLPVDPSVQEEVLGPVGLGGMRQKVTSSEIAIETNNHCEELLHFIREEITSNSQRHFTDLARLLREEIREEMQQQFQAQLVQMQSHMQNLQLQPSLSIDQEHLEITEHVLGRGAYGGVKVGMYQGTRVAVKKIHGRGDHL